MGSSDSSFRTDGDADTIGARAVAVLAASEIDEADLARVRDWINANPTHRAAFDRARRAWATSGRVAHEARTRGDLSSQRDVRSRFVPSGVASAGCAVALLALYLAFTTLVPRRGLLETQVAEVKRLSLPDGTVAWLDANSAMRLRFSDDQRHVELVRGRVSFRVHEDSKRPFQVEALGAVARDIGTEFSINQTSDAATLIVREGIVQVDKTGRAVVLAAGETTQWTVDSPPTPSAVIDADTANAWRNGKLAFDGTRLADALEEISRHRPGALWLMDSAIEGRPVSGVIFTDRIEEGLDTLAAGAKVRLVRLPFLTLVFGV